MPSCIKNCLFDLGNVVLKIDFDHCFRYWSLKSKVPFEAFKKGFSQDLDYQKHERGEISGEEYWKSICRKFNVKLSYDDFELGWNSIFEHPIQPTFEIIKKFKNNIGIHAYTNTNEIHRNAWTKKFSLEMSHFEKIYCSNQLGFRKPESRGFEFILSDLRTAPAELVFIDDMLENTEAAKKMGMNVIHFTEPRVSIQQLENLISLHRS